MTKLVPEDEIESIVGASRRPTHHIGRADSESETFYILHSRRCKDREADLRDCVHSKALSRGIDSDDWAGWEDIPVRLGIGHEGKLVPLGYTAEEGERE